MDAGIYFIYEYAFPFLQHLEKGKINPRNLKDLKVFEKALNTFFTSLYSDIKNVYYKLDSCQYELTFKHILKHIQFPFPLLHLY